MASEFKTGDIVRETSTGEYFIVDWGDPAPYYPKFWKYIAVKQGGGPSWIVLADKVKKIGHCEGV